MKFRWGGILYIWVEGAERSSLFLGSRIEGVKTLILEKNIAG